MLYRRQGFPEDGEVLLCTVTKVNPDSVFVHINEYEKSGMIHISEISPGRIRNIREFVSEGKVIVCKVLRVNRERGHIDLSLRRVNESLRRNKLDEVKQEQKAEKLIELVAQKMKKDFKKVYDEISASVRKEYDMLWLAFTDVAVGKTTLEALGVAKEYQKELDESIQKRFRAEKIAVEGILKLQTYADDGVAVIIKALKTIEALPNAIVRYLGAGAYKITIDSEDVKKDEKMLDEKVEEVLEFMKKNDGSGSFAKEAAEE
ncbi:MAG TPA: S1 RNA-binding domain-containing protein [Candidatus Nanoarchaeia archaeon]|nr:S1 RNA-binding domain-containing protein [Candidatus Nanoarchaeia archaeon]